MAGKVHRRLPIEPLIEACVVRYGCGDAAMIYDEILVERTQNLTHIARMTGIARGMWNRWIREGSIPEGSAARVLAILGKHALEVWPDIDDEVLV